MSGHADELAGPALYDIEGAGFSAAGRVLLHALTLSLPARAVCGLIGHNGSGKTTLLKLLARQQPSGSGMIRFRGRPLVDWGAREFARRVAYLPQQPPGVGGLTVRELVALGRYPWHGPLGRFDAGHRHVVEEAMVLTDVAKFGNRIVESLSGGERQRVWLAMLLAQNADCLLLDEPISALDVAHQVEVLDLVCRLSRDRGLGVVVVLHDINMAARYCDELVALHRGRLLARGAPAEIMQPDVLQAIYGISMGILPHPRNGLPISYVL